MVSQSGQVTNEMPAPDVRDIMGKTEVVHIHFDKDFHAGQSVAIHTTRYSLMLFPISTFNSSLHNGS